jgi:hypothetical protein
MMSWIVGLGCWVWWIQGGCQESWWELSRWWGVVWGIDEFGGYLGGRSGEMVVFVNGWWMVDGDDVNAVHWISSQSTDTVPNPGPTWVPELRKDFMVRSKAECSVERWRLQCCLVWVLAHLFEKEGCRLTNKSLLCRGLFQIDSDWEFG